MRNQSGFTLLETLVGVGAAGIVVAAMATAHVAMRDNFIRDQASREADALRNQIDGTLSTPALCAKAMIAGGGPPVWSNIATPSGPIDSIVITNATATSSTPSLVTPGRYSNNLWIRRMYLRQPLNIANSIVEGIPVTLANGTLDRGGAAAAIPVRYVPAKLVIEVASNRTIPLPTADMKAPTVDLIVALDAGGQVVQCASNLRNVYTTNYKCTEENIPTANRCSTASSPFNPVCHHFYYIAGIDASGNADCRCVVTCNNVSASQVSACLAGGASLPECNGLGATQGI